MCVCLIKFNRALLIDLRPKLKNTIDNQKIGVSIKYQWIVQLPRLFCTCTCNNKFLWRQLVQKASYYGWQSNYRSKAYVFKELQFGSHFLFVQACGLIKNGWAPKPGKKKERRKREWSHVWDRMQGWGLFNGTLQSKAKFINIIFASLHCNHPHFNSHHGTHTCTQHIHYYLGYRITFIMMITFMTSLQSCTNRIKSYILHYKEQLMMYI